MLTHHPLTSYKGSGSANEHNCLSKYRADLAEAEVEFAFHGENTTILRLFPSPFLI